MRGKRGEEKREQELATVLKDSLDLVHCGQRPSSFTQRSVAAMMVMTTGVETNCLPSRGRSVLDHLHGD